MPERGDSEADVPTLDPGFTRKRTGLARHETRGLVRALRSGMSWEKATAHLVNDVEASVLERWRERLLRDAAAGPSAVLPAKSSGGKPAVPPAIAKLMRARQEASRALADAHGAVAELRAGVEDGEIALRQVRARAAVRAAGNRPARTAAAKAVARARKVLQEAISAQSAAELRAEEVAVQVATLDEELALAERQHGLERKAKLRQGLDAWCREHEEGFLDDLARVLATVKARTGGIFHAAAGHFETHLVAHFAMRVSPQALQARISHVEEQILASGDETPEADQPARGKVRRRAEGMS